MKLNKLFSVLALSAMTLSMSAAITSKATINVAGQYTDDELYIYEDVASTQLVDKIDNAMSPFSVNLYATVNSVNYSSVKQSSLNNLKVYFKANSQEESYTLTLSDVLGNIMLVCGSDTITSTKNNPYVVNCAKSATVEFTVNPVSEDVYTRTVTSGDWGTICLPKASSKIEGATMYEVLGLDLNQGVALGEFLAAQQMVAGTPYVFKATAAELKVTYTGDAVTDTVVVKGGFFGSFAGMDVEEGKYILYNNMLYQAGAGCSILANRAFFDLDNMEEYEAQQAQGRKVVFMGTEATGLEAVKAAGAKAQKVMINGQMVIIRDGKMFNAQGAEL